MKLYNTLSRSIEEFTPINNNTVSLYCCGPTVYDYTHIGHIRKYVMDDMLRRTLEYLDYDVKHVMNITDVGHLTDDADTGEDKLEKGAKKSGKTVWEVAQFYTKFFQDTMEKVNVKLPTDNMLCKATDHVAEMIEMIKKLEENGLTYETQEAVYFDTTKFPDYGKLSRQKIEEKKQAAREDVNIDSEKKHPADFAVWFKRVGRFENHTMHWQSPWGDGFPGWHIECSAMSTKYLGDQIDIHTGGIDHIPVHHENEIAQTEGATGKKPFVKYWVHHNFLMVEGTKMSKSLGNFITIEDIEKKGINPLSLRLLFLQVHYRQEMNFTWEAAEAANEAYKKLVNQMAKLRENNKELSEEEKKEFDNLKDAFTAVISNDLEFPKALAIIWDTLKMDISDSVKFHFIRSADEIFGLELAKQRDTSLPAEIEELKKKRDEAREKKDWQSSDSLRDQIEAKGFIVEDFASGTVITKK